MSLIFIFKINVFELLYFAVTTKLADPRTINFGTNAHVDKGTHAVKFKPDYNCSRSSFILRSNSRNLIGFVAYNLTGGPVLREICLPSRLYRTKYRIDTQRQCPGAIRVKNVEHIFTHDCNISCLELCDEVGARA